MKKLIIAALALLCVSVPGRAQNKVAVRPIGQTVVSFSATPTFDFGVTNAVKITLTANVTSSTAIGLEAGQHPVIEVCQDGTGSRTFAFPAQFAGAIAVLPGANACIAELFYFDGTTANIITTTTAGGGGSGTINSGTGKCFTWYATTGTTVSADCNLDDGLTTASTLTYAPAGGIAAQQFNSTAAGAWTALGTNGTCSGATSGKTGLCLGDSVSASAQVSNSGDSYRPIALHQSTSPVPGGVMVAGVFPQMISVARGTPGQSFIEGTTGGNGGFGQLDISLSTNVINRLAKANQTASTIYNDQVNALTSAGTLDASASTVSSAVRVPNGAGLTTLINGALGYDTTNNLFHCGTNSADARCVVTTITPTDTFCAQWTRTSGHYELGQASGTCSTPGGAGALSGITAATGANSINNGDFAQIWNWAPTTAGRIGMRHSENSAGTATGTPFLEQWDTLAGSTTNPVQWCAQGTANCWRVDTNALFKPIGAAAMAIPGSAKGVVVSQGPTAANTTVTGSLNQLISFDASGNPIAADPIISYNYVNIWTAQDVTVTRTSAVARNPIFSQTGTLQLTWASITGSPATCTLQIQGVDSVGNALNNGSTFSVSPANGTTSQTFTAAAALQSAAQIKAIFACVTYPTTGTLTLDFTPIPNVNVTNTVAVSAASLPLPTGAATAAKQPALGTAGTASADVITVQGIASMTALKVDGSAVTQPVSGTVTTTPPSNASTNITQKAGVAVIADPCEVNAKVYDSFSGTANTQLITGTSAKKIYFCSFTILVGAATNVAIVEGTGTVCATGIAKFPGLSGGTTAATGWNLSANGGLTYGNGGSSIAAETTNADNVCVLVSAANQTNISYSYVVQ